MNLWGSLWGSESGSASGDAADLTSGTATDGYVLTADGSGGAAWEGVAGGGGDVAGDIHVATDKATPVDADELGLADSAAAWVLKKLSWANLKATLSGVFAVLAGKSGGQTLIGGTGGTDKLTLQGTSGNGTVTASALEVKVGNNGSLSALNLLNNGQLIIQGDVTTDLPVYGSELLTSAGWTVTDGWTESPDDVFAHSSGTTTLSHSATITNGAKYQISWTIDGRTTGSITVAVGGQSVSATVTESFGPTATATTAFTITPTTDFNGTVSLVSLKIITGPSTPVMVGKSSDGTVIWENRTGLFNTNAFIGLGAGSYNTTGTDNNAQGRNALFSNTTGKCNNAQGRNALFSNVTGNFNCAMGGNALQLNVTGSSNIAIGYSSLGSNVSGGDNTAIGYLSLSANNTGLSNTAVGNQCSQSATTGNYNTSLGYNSLRFNVTGSNNAVMGYNAGTYHANGSTSLTDPENSVYIGSNARGKDNADSNSVVIGGDTPIGLGANTTVIGTSATTLTRLYGNLGLGVDSPSAAIHAIKTTEQLRIGYDASNFLSVTVSSTGNLTLDTTGGTIYTPDTIENTVAGAGIILKSPDGTRYRLTVANGGTLSISAA